METGRAITASLLRFLSWILLNIAGLLIVILDLRAIVFQDTTTYT
jgi:hypothetical protein